MEDRDSEPRRGRDDDGRKGCSRIGTATSAATPRASAVALVLTLALAGCGAHGRAPAASVMAVPGPARTVPAGLLGFNGEAVTGPGRVWSDARFARAVAALRPQALRVFGGSPANYWDWRAGTFVRSPLLPASFRRLRSQVHVTLADWARVVRATHATPVFDLNLLTSDLSDQLAMLRAARRLGMPVTRVELGNELYLPAYARRFHDGAAYGRVATRWIAALTQAFPGIQAAADAFGGRDTNSGASSARERAWNAAMLRTLRGEAALSFHIYFASGLGAGHSLARPAAAARMLTAPARRWAAFSRRLATLPAGVQAWVTEWNLFDRRARVHGTWAQGLDVAAFGLDLVTAPRVAHADYHALVSSAPFGALFGDRAGLALGVGRGGGAFSPVLARPPATSRFGLGAGGVAMQALLGALAGAREARVLSFPPDASGALRGAAFDRRAGAGASAVIANLSAERVAVGLPVALIGLRYSERWAAPAALVNGLASLRMRSGRAAAVLELEPFSLALVGGA